MQQTAEAAAKAVALYLAESQQELLTGVDIDLDVAGICCDGVRDWFRRSRTFQLMPQLLRAVSTISFLLLERLVLESQRLQFM